MVLEGSVDAAIDESLRVLRRWQRQVRTLLVRSQRSSAVRVRYLMTRSVAHADELPERLLLKSVLNVK